MIQRPLFMPAIRTRRSLSGVASVVLAAAVTGTCLAQPAAADTSHNPFGYLDSVVAASPTAIKVTGWAADPDDLARPLTITATVDGRAAGQVLSAVARPDVAKARGTGPTPGFALSLTTVAGSHVVCVSAVNVGSGANSQLGCRTVLNPGPAGAQPTAAEIAAQSPIGAVDSAVVATSSVQLTGWAADPGDLTKPLRIAVTVDGAAAVVTAASVVARPDVAAARRTGPNQGFKVTVNAASGVHTVCAVATNIGVGANKAVGCRGVQVGPPPPSAAEIAAHSPSGALESATAVGSTAVRVVGWASDPDNRATALEVVGYLDGSSAATVSANIARPELVTSQHTGPAAGYTFSVAANTGSHLICAWAVNIGVGANKYLGCSAFSTPAVSMPTGPTPATPAANTKVTTLAAKYLGYPYVWGGASPSTGFDCSGLVQYTYRVGAGITTPRIAQDQFHAAHRITAGRAVPGDLVFFHDSTGSVYHVGIYAGPGTMYAAVDPANGVRYQNIWDSTATYGSFTHS